MRGLLIAVGLVLAGSFEAALAQTAQPDARFRIGVVGAAPVPCSAEKGIAGADALAGHLSARLQRPTETCTYGSTLDAGKALSAGEVDFVKLDASGMAAGGTAVRALIAPRAPGSIGRILSVAIVRADSPAQRLTDMHGLRVAYAGFNPAHYAGPKAALKTNGWPADAVASEQVEVTPEAALKSLKSGGSDLLVMHASAWQRVCRGEKPADKPCAGLREVFRGRERLAEAYAVRTSLDQETRLRLVGVLVALHLENRAAFDWLAPGAAELTPTEADAVGAGSVAP